MSLSGQAPPLPMPSPKSSLPQKASPFLLGLQITYKSPQQKPKVVVDPMAHKRETLPIPSTSKDYTNIRTPPKETSPQPETSADSMTAEPPSVERSNISTDVPMSEQEFVEEFTSAAVIPKEEDKETIEMEEDDAKGDP